MKSKGFTLVELLAVIVILAIIALIAVPIFLGMINNSKKNSDKETVNLYTDTVEKAIQKKQMADPNFQPDKCTIKSDGNLECFNGTTSLGTVKISMKGTKPTSGTILIDDDDITYQNIVLNDKTYYEKTYIAFNVGDKISYNNVTYYVIENSGTSNDTVKLIKENPLTSTEISSLNLSDIEVTGETYGKVIFGSSTDYSTSIVKQIVDAWASNAIKSGDNAIARLITKEEIENNFEFEEFDYKPCGACEIETAERIETEWMYNENYLYWGMTPIEIGNTVNAMMVTNLGQIGNSSSMSPNAGVRPVLDLNKSATITKLES